MLYLREYVAVSFNWNVCRYIIIKFADRGLTKNGKHNLRMFESISWIWFIVSALAPILQHLWLSFLPDAPSNLVHGNIWDLKLTHDYRGKLIVGVDGWMYYIIAVP
jgi:hypothetical protein